MIHALADARRLALARLAILATWVFDIARDPFPDLAALPVTWFSAHGPWLLMPEGLVRALWSTPALLALKLVTLSCLVLALLGVAGYRAWAALAALLLTLVTGFVRGFGHADHAQVQLLFVTYALLFLPAWDALSLQSTGRARPSGVYAASFAALSLVFAIPYFAIAIYRLTHEGAALYFGSSMLHFIARDTLSLDHFDFSMGLDLVETQAFRAWLNLGFAVITLAELASPWVHLRRSWCVLWLALIGPFHLLSPLLMHVAFFHNLVLLVVLYVVPLCWRGRSQPAAAAV